MKDEFVKLHFDIISGDFIKAGEASSNIKRAFLQLGINNDIIKRVCVSCYEAEINIVIHSIGGYMDIFIYENKVEINANDFGPGIENIALAMKEGYSTANEAAREMGFGAGMGLPNMKKSCDNFEISSIPGQYTHVKMIIKF
jgi:anti-sigma regulatory factor (Ser/Thr protein kinase)